MRKHKFILALDPSGNFKEGSGTTGWCFGSDKITSAGYLKADLFKSQEAFWAEQLKLITNFHLQYKDDLAIVCEDYLLYADKADSQINSRMETCKLIGAIQVECYRSGTTLEFQNASEVKNRWSNEVLVAKGVLIKKGKFLYLPEPNLLRVNRHIVDSVRHWTHYSTFKNHIVESHTDKPPVRSTAKY